MTDLPFSFPFYSLEDINPDINPDNFLSEERTSCGSEYYAEEQLLEILSKTESATSFNLVSYNIRSMRKNFEEFCDDILESLPTLSAIALQETWLSTED